MKRKSIIFVLFLFTSLIHFSCKNTKSVEPIPIQPPLKQTISIQEAKNFYENTLKNSSKKSFNRNDIELEKLPRWYEAYQLTNLYNKPQLNVPLYFTGHQTAYRIQNDDDDTLTSQSDIVQIELIIYRDNYDELKAVVGKSIATKEYLRANGFKVNPQNFTGIRIVEDWDGNFLVGFQYTNGQISGIVNQNSPTNRENVANCTYIVLDIYYRDCYGSSCGDWTYGGSEILGVSCNFSADALEQIPYEGMVGGWLDGSGRDPNNGLDEIELEIQDECIKEIIENLIDSDTSIADSTRKHFGVGKKRLVFHQSSAVDALMPPTSSGETYISNASANPPTQSSHINIISIDLNGIFLANASQEYIAETAIHEMIHANLYMNGNIGTANAQHLEMLTNQTYLNQVVSSLQAMFPHLSPEDAKVIFFSGFGGFISSSQENRNLWLQTLRKHDLTEAFVNMRSEQYRLGQVGTPKCN